MGKDNRSSKPHQRPILTAIFFSSGGIRMESLPPLTDLILMLGLFTVGSCLAGMLAGLFGIGGGAVLVPIFYPIFGFLGVDEAYRMHLCVGTSLAVIIPTSIRSVRGHMKTGRVDTVFLKNVALYVLLGVICASSVAAYLSSGALRMIFAVCVLVIGLKLLLAKDNWRLGNDLPTGLGRGIAGWLIGFLSTFMGIGGGTFNNTFMTAYGRPIHQAVATSAGMGLLISVPGVIGFIIAGWGAEDLPDFTIGYVHLLLALVTVCVTLLTVPMGVKLAHRLQKRQLEVAFGAFLLLVSARFFYTLS